MTSNNTSIYNNRSIIECNPFYNTKHFRRSAYSLVSSIQTSLKEEHISSFLLNINMDENCLQSSKKIYKWVKRQTGHLQISEIHVYRLLLHVVNTYDFEQQQRFKHKGISVKSSFALRNLILFATQKSRVSLPSYSFFIKKTEPLSDLWHFLDNWSSWVPEEQRVMGKWMEISFVKMHKLAQAYSDPHVILFKGGFGAGKTSLAIEMFGEENALGVVAPDKAKNIIRRFFPHIPHCVAHTQGSVIAYKLFNQMLPIICGTIAYDSALNDPKDVSNYISVAESLGKKVIIYDVARIDVLRALAVLKRPIDGEDPRIPPDVIIDSSILSKLQRVDCMKAVLKHRPKTTDKAPEYHFLVTNSRGTDRENILILTHDKIQIPEKAKKICKKRLKIEQLKIDATAGAIFSTTTEIQLREQYHIQFNQPVKEHVSQLATKDKLLYEKVFQQRILPFQKSDQFLTNETLYSALAPHFQSQISADNFNSALLSLSESSQSNFITLCNKKIQARQPVSYLDLPLHMALALHANLQEDPWA